MYQSIRDLGFGFNLKEGSVSLFENQEFEALWTNLSACLLWNSTSTDCLLQALHHSSLSLKISLVKAPGFSESIVKANHNFISAVFFGFFKTFTCRRQEEYSMHTTYCSSAFWCMLQVCCPDSWSSSCIRTTFRHLLLRTSWTSSPLHHQLSGSSKLIF